MLLCLHRDSTVDHPSLLSGHVSVKSCQKAFHHTLFVFMSVLWMCLLSTVGVLLWGQWLAQVGPRHVWESCLQKSPSSSSKLGDPASVTFLTGVTCLISLLKLFLRSASGLNTNIWFSSLLRIFNCVSTPYITIKMKC